MASPDELWLVDFGEPFPSEPARRRPALVVGPPAAFGAGFPVAIVMPLTTVDRGLSIHVRVPPTPSTGLDATSYIQCEAIRSVAIRRLIERLGVVDQAVARQVEDILRMLLGH